MFLSCVLYNSRWGVTKGRISKQILKAKEITNKQIIADFLFLFDLFSSKKNMQSIKKIQGTFKLSLYFYDNTGNIINHWR
jgi:hypothetical protein